MNTDEHSVQTETKTYGSEAPSPDAKAGISSNINSLSTDDFHPAVVAVSRLAASNRKYIDRAEVKVTGDELAKLTGELMSSIESNDASETNLRTQSEIINRAFMTLMMKTTRNESFDEDAFASALRAQRQYRQTCQMLSDIKKEKEQTEKNARNSVREALRRNPNVDPYAHQYMDR